MPAGVSSKLGYYLIGKQASKGVVATSFNRYRASGEPNIRPEKVVNRYHMTDVGRDQGDAYTSVVRVEGDLPMYLHPDGAAQAFYYVLGTNVDSGAGPNYTHTITPADDLPWFTVFRVVGGSIQEQFLDCKLNTLALTSEAGDAPQMTWSVFGITPTFEAALPGTIVVITGDPYKHWEGKNLYSIGGAPQPVHRYSIEITNGLIPFQADDYFLHWVDPGERAVTFNYSMHFSSPTSEPKYREFMYGSDAGTAVSTALPSKAVDFTVRRNADTEVNIVFPNVRHAAVPVNPNPSGEPIDVEVATVVEKPVGGDITTVTVKDQTATVG